MAVSLKASKQGLKIVDRARRMKGWKATATAWCDLAKTSEATLKRFREGKPILQDAFIGICQAVGIEDWKTIVDGSITEQNISIYYLVQEPEEAIAQQCYQALTNSGYRVYLARENETNSLERLDAELKKCDRLVLLLSENSATSEMMTEVIRRFKELHESGRDRQPAIFPILVNLPDSESLNYEQRSYLHSIPQREWRSPADTSRLLQEIFTWLETGKNLTLPRVKTSPKPSLSTESPDVPPLPVAEPELQREPGGSIPLNSNLYIERPPLESQCYQEILQPGALIRIKAPRQMGKTSLLARILGYAREQGYQTVPLSFQQADSTMLANLEQLLRWFCEQVGRRLKQLNQLDDYWVAYGSKDKCNVYFEDCLLTEIDQPVVIGLDEVDRVFPHRQVADDFLGLLRSWYELARFGDLSGQLWEKLRLVIVHSREVYIPLDINQSPFNVGMNVGLSEFDCEQVRNLAIRYELNKTGVWLEKLMRLVGGHPYLVRKAFYHLRRRDVGWEKLIETAPTEEGIYSDHLRRHLWNLRQHPLLAEKFRQVAMKNQSLELDTEFAFKLDSMGLVELQGNECRPRCDLYRLYFRDRLTT